MMLLMKPFIHWQVFTLAVKKSMHEMKKEIFRNHTDQYLFKNSHRICWNFIDTKLPGDLPIIKPRNRD